MTVVNYTLDPSAEHPTRPNPGDAGFDLHALEEAWLYKGMPKLIKTGLRVAIPTGYVGLVCSRSGLALKHGIHVLNSPGIVDSGYRGDVGVILTRLAQHDDLLDANNHNYNDYPHYIAKGDRVAQLLIVHCNSFLQYVTQDAFESHYSETERGEGGFGSTGR